MMGLVLFQNGSYLSLRLMNGLDVSNNVRKIILVHDNVIAVQEIRVIYITQLSLSCSMSGYCVLLYFGLMVGRKRIKGC